MTRPGGEGFPPPDEFPEPAPRFTWATDPDETGDIPRYTDDPWEDEPIFVGPTRVADPARGGRRPGARPAPRARRDRRDADLDEEPIVHETLAETIQRRMSHRDLARILRVGVDPETGERLTAADRAEIRALLEGPAVQQLSRRIPSTHTLPNRRRAERIGYSPARGFQRARRRAGEMLTEWPRSLVGTLGLIAMAGMTYAQVRYGSADMGMAAADFAQHVTPVAEEGTRSASAVTDSFVELVRSSVDKVPVVGGVASPLAELAATVAVEAPVDIAAGAVREIMPNSAEEFRRYLGSWALIGGVMIFDTPRSIVRQGTTWVADRAQRGINIGSSYAVQGIDIAGAWAQRRMRAAGARTRDVVFGRPRTEAGPDGPGEPGNFVPRPVSEHFRRLSETLRDPDVGLLRKIGAVAFRGTGGVLLAAANSPIVATRLLARPFQLGARMGREAREAFREERARRAEERREDARRERREREAEAFDYDDL